MNSSSTSQILAADRTGEITTSDRARESLIVSSNVTGLRDSVVTIRTSYIVFKEKSRIRRSFSQEDISLYETQTKKKSVYESLALEKENEKDAERISGNISNESSVKDENSISKRSSRSSRSIPSDKLQIQDKVSDYMKSAVTLTRSQKLSNKDNGDANKNMEDTLESIMNYLDTNNNAFEGFGSGVRGRPNLTEDRDNISMQLRKILENEQEEAALSGGSKPEVGNEESGSNLTASNMSKSVELPEGVSIWRKILALMSICLNLFFLYLIMHPHLHTTAYQDYSSNIETMEKWNEVASRYNNTVVEDAVPELYFAPVANTCNITYPPQEESSDDGQYEAHIRLLEGSITKLEGQLDLMKDRKKNDNRIIVELASKNDRLVEEFNKIEENLQHTFEIIGKLKKHIASPEVGDALLAHFSRLINLIRKNE